MGDVRQDNYQVIPLSVISGVTPKYVVWRNGVALAYTNDKEDAERIVNRLLLGAKTEQKIAWLESQLDQVSKVAAMRFKTIEIFKRQLEDVRKKNLELVKQVMNPVEERQYLDLRVRLHGTVYANEQTQDPLKDAFVYLEQGPHVFVVVNGRFESMVKPGRYTLCACAPGYALASREVYVDGETQSHREDFYLSPTPRTGAVLGTVRVKDRQDVKPLADVKITADHGFRTSTVSRDGSYRLDGVPLGPVTVRASWGPHATQRTFVLDQVDGRLDLTLPSYVPSLEERVAALEEKVK